MKPLGTITMYLKFINSDDKAIMEVIATESENYREFVSRLADYVYTKDVSSEIAHTAILHAWELRETGIIQNIASKYGESSIVKPWTYPLRTKSDRLSSSHHIRDAIELAMHDNPPDWIRMNLLLLRSYTLIHTSQGSVALDAAKALLESSTDFSCFRPYFHHIECRLIYEQEGNLSEAISICKKGLELATEDDNLYQAIWLNRWLGMFTMNTDRELAFQHLEEAYRLAKNLGTPFHTAAVLTEMGWISDIRGEYDLAFAFYDEARTLATSMDEISDRHALVLSNASNNLNDAQQALDWAKWALDWHLKNGSEGDTWIHTAMAWALTLLGRLEEASEHLDISIELAFRSGQEREIAVFYLVSGIYENSSGDPASAIETLKGALEICERTETQQYTNRTLLALVSAEIELFKQEGGDDTSDSSGQWMTYLEDTARSKNLPGILIQHAILKADFQVAQGRTDEARATLVNALDIYNSPGVRTLQKAALEKIRLIDMNKVIH
ncbi:MAG: tetratricopeptide repeat protein [Candidatus Thorarchaeota archaeon]